MTPAVDAALSALGAFGKKLDVTANNIANVDTEGFEKSRALLEDTDQSGVIVTISQVNTPGGPMPDDQGTGELKESSNVDLAEEFVNLHTTKYDYQANLKTIQTEDEMLGSLYDIFA